MRRYDSVTTPDIIPLRTLIHPSTCTHNGQCQKRNPPRTGLANTGTVAHIRQMVQSDHLTK